MDRDSSRLPDLGKRLTRLFDQTLRDHIERLIGTRYGIGGLELGVVSIASLIFVSEQAKNEAGGSTSSDERYTLEGLEQELSELGIEWKQDISRALCEIQEKGYVKMGPDGRLAAEKPALTMTQLLDRVFPGMPGLTLVAYFIQTIDEVRQGRKDLLSGISQFDQTLRLRSAPHRKARPLQEETTGRPSSPQISQKESGSKRPSPADTQHALESGMPHRMILSSELNGAGVEVRKVEVEDLFAMGDQLDRTLETRLTEPSEGLEGLLTHGGDEETQEPGDAVAPSPETPPVPEMAYPEPAQTHNLALEASERTPAPEKKIPPREADLDADPEESKPEASFSDHVQAPATEYSSDPHAGAEQAIEKMVAAFEEQLAMQCPVCKAGRVEIHKTATDKTYYKCSENSCIFVSWGKPYHLPCPSCHNPFLVEATDREGRLILRCPRATCRHSQRHPSEAPPDHEIPAGLSTQQPVQLSPSSKGTRMRVAKRVVRKKR